MSAPLWYSVTLSIGSHSWTRTTGDPAADGPLLPLSTGWAMPDDQLGYPAVPEPRWADFGLLLGEPDDYPDVALGADVSIDVTFDDTFGAVFAEFTGRVAQLDAEPDPLGLRYRVQCVDYTVDLAEETVGETAWPAESAADRVARIAAEAGWTLPAFGWDPLGGTIAARDASAASALELLTEVAAHGVTSTPDVPRRDLFTARVPGQLLWQYGMRSVIHIDRVDAGWVALDSKFTATKRNNAKRVAIVYPTDRVRRYGSGWPVHPRVETRVLDPDELGKWILATDDASPGWQVETMRLELWKVPQSYLEGFGNPPPLGKSWMYAAAPDDTPIPFGRAVSIEGVAVELPVTANPGSRLVGMLVGAELVLPESGRVVIDFDLSLDVPPHTSGGVAWDEADPALTWDTVDPAVTWADARTMTPDTLTTAP